MDEMEKNDYDSIDWYKIIVLFFVACVFAFLVVLHCEKEKIKQSKIPPVEKRYE